MDIAKISKGTYCGWDVLEQAGLTEKARDIRHLELLNNNSGGEVRLYDMYIRVPDRSAGGIGAVFFSNESEEVWYDLTGRRLSSLPARTGVYVRNGRKVVIR